MCFAFWQAWLDQILHSDHVPQQLGPQAWTPGQRLPSQLLCLATWPGMSPQPLCWLTPFSQQAGQDWTNLKHVMKVDSGTDRALGWLSAHSWQLQQARHVDVCQA